MLEEILKLLGQLFIIYLLSVVVTLFLVFVVNSFALALRKIIKLINKKYNK